MPILVAERAVFPDNLLTEVGRQTEDRTWMVMYTRSRQEKALVRSLGAQEVPHYLPLVERRVLVRGKTVKAHVPVFSSYVFVYGTLIERELCLKTNRVCQVLPVFDGLALCEDLARVHSLIESGCPLTVEARLSPGQWVRVRSGPLLGVEGTIVRRKAETRLLVAVRMLQQGVSVEINDHLVEPIATPFDITA